MLSGELDACVVDSVGRVGRSRHDDAVAGLRVVDRLGPWPVQPLLARADLDPCRVAEVRDTILRLGDRSDVRAQLDASALAGFVAIDAGHYEPVTEAFERHLRV